MGIEGGDREEGRERETMEDEGTEEDGVKKVRGMEGGEGNIEE